VSSWFWIYWTVAIPLTLLVLGVWYWSERKIKVIYDLGDIENDSMEKSMMVESSMGGSKD